MKQVHQEDKCPLGGSTGPVVLAITVGDGHVGTSIVVVGGVPVAAGADLTHVLLGQAEDLRGKAAVITSTISREPYSTDHLSAVYDIVGNQIHQRFVIADQFEGSVSASVVETIGFS